MTKRVTLHEIDRLSAAEKILLVQDLWDSVADDPEAWPLTSAQKTELARREKAYQADKKAGRAIGVTWAAAKRQARKGKR